MRRREFMALAGGSQPVWRKCPVVIIGALCAPAHRTPRHLTKQAERAVLADLQTPLSIAKLCRTLGVSDRYLRRAYQEVHGMPPLQYLRTLKLSRARRALTSARSQSVTVSKIATRLGFREFGRFSVQYRK